MTILDRIMINGIFGMKTTDKKLFIFGSNGMLGQYLKNYLQDYYKVITVNRKDLDASKTDKEKIKSLLKSKNFNENDVVLNCVGTIKPRVDELGTLNAILVNSVFPHILSESVLELNGKMIHFTTDCVYDGFDGNYIELNSHNITDVYGRTKSLGEPNNITVIRTSIIGEELDNKRSLVEWIKSNKNGEINGFNNHYWNGVTCLQLAKICHNIIKSDSFWVGVRHIFSNILSKYDLLELINSIYDLNIKVNEVASNQKIDRTLNTTYQKIEVPYLRQQIREMKDFKLKK